MLHHTVLLQLSLKMWHQKITSHILMICGNPRDFIDHPLPKDSVGPPTTPGTQAPHHPNPALYCLNVYAIADDIPATGSGKNMIEAEHDHGQNMKQLQERCVPKNIKPNAKDSRENYWILFHRISNNCKSNRVWLPNWFSFENVSLCRCDSCETLLWHGEVHS